MQKISRINVQSLKTLVLAGLLLSIVLLAGCTTQSSSAQPLSPGVTNGAIIKDPAVYEGKDLVLKGKIAIECGSGCWFLLDDGTGQLYVDLADNNFAIPQLVGSTVVVKGVIRVENGDPKLYATNVTTDSRTYP
jgi:outer membrane protein assembly factor BamB